MDINTKNQVPKSLDSVPPLILYYANIEEHDVDSYIEDLPKSDQHRVTQIKHDLTRQQFILARTLLYGAFDRLELPRLSTFPSSPQYTAMGKPYFHTGPSFNISHSEKYVAVILQTKGPHCELGLDIEYVERDIDFNKIAKRFFSKNEYNTIVNSTNPKQLFYKLWTAKEAYLKSLGVGLKQPITSVTSIEFSWNESLTPPSWIPTPSKLSQALTSETSLSDLTLTSPDFEFFSLQLSPLLAATAVCSPTLHHSVRELPLVATEYIPG